MADNQFVITAVHSPSWDDDEVRRRLGKVYSLILSCKCQERRKQRQDTADRGELGDLTRTAADDTPAVKPEAHDAV